MVTMLEECSTIEQHSVLHFLWAKGLNAKDIHKEMFPICCIKWFSQGLSKAAVDAQPGVEVAKTTVKRLLYCRFQRISKAMGQV
jgi:hypothetical protein